MTLRTIFAATLTGGGVLFLVGGVAPNAPAAIESCAPASPQPPVSVPSPDTQVRGTVITVTTNSDAVNGNVSSAAGLNGNPGPDGISLREAVLVTNNATGVYSIKFAPNLYGKTIAVGAVTGFPALTGGSVFINGDLDADGDADVTVSSARPYDPDSRVFFLVTSGGNRIHGLVFREFSGGIMLAPVSPVSTDGTYSGNEISGVVMAGAHTGGLSLFTAFGSSGGSTPTGNRWLNTRVLGNTFLRTGIFFSLTATAESSIEHLTIAGNTVQIPTGGEVAIALVSGGGPTSTDNRISDVLIANNTISGYPAQAIGVTSGGVGGSRNSIDGIRIANNQIQGAIGIGTGDAASDHVDPNPPIIYPENNVLENLAVTGNTITGESPSISVSGGCCGAARNAVRSLQIAGNTLSGKASGPTPGIVIGGAGTGNYVSRASAENAISDVAIRRNSITLTTPSSYVPALGLSAGILLLGASGADGNSVTDVDLAENCIDTDLIGLDLIGGIEDKTVTMPATDNSVSGIAIRGNKIVRPPSRMTPLLPGLKGINLIGGMESATGNRAKNVVLADNSVAGVRDDVSTFPNLGTGASGNVAEVIRDGDGTLTTPTSAVSGASTGKTITFTYTAVSGGMQNGAVTIAVPSGWSAPSTNPSAPGYTKANFGTVSTSGQVITVSNLTRAGGQAVTIGYGLRGGGGPGATAPSVPGPQTWKAMQRATPAGTLRNLIAGSPVITVYARDGSGTLVTPTTSVAHGSTGNTIAFTYTAAAGGMLVGTLTLAVPAGWSAPSASPSARGYTTASTGTLSVSGNTITVSNVTRSGGATLVVTYGSKAGGGPGATAPSSAVGAQTWQAKQRSVTGGLLTSLLAGSPAISVG